MSPVEETTGNGNVQQPAQGKPTSGKQEITPELVSKVADKVYSMLMAELTLENERSRMFRKHTGGR